VALGGELLEVRREYQSGSGTELRGRIGPDGVQQFVAAAKARVDCLEQASLTIEPVREVLVQLRLGIPYVGPVPRAEDLEVELLQAAQGVEVGGQRTLARGDEDAAGAEHRVAREQHASGEQAHAVRRVARRRERAERPDLLTARRQRHRGAELLGPLGVVRVRVGEDDALDPFAGRLANCLQMRRIGRPRIDYPAVHDVAVGPVEGEGRWVGGTYPDDAVRFAF
jgi:hypothetical protein